MKKYVPIFEAYLLENDDAAKQAFIQKVAERTHMEVDLLNKLDMDSLLDLYNGDMTVDEATDLVRQDSFPQVQNVDSSQEPITTLIEVDPPVGGTYDVYFTSNEFEEHITMSGEVTETEDGYMFTPHPFDSPITKGWDAYEANKSEIDQMIIDKVMEQNR